MWSKRTLTDPIGVATILALAGNLFSTEPRQPAAVSHLAATVVAISRATATTKLHTVSKRPAYTVAI
jgi:hypothetical protein